MDSDNVQLKYAEWLATEYRPIAGADDGTTEPDNSQGEDNTDGLFDLSNVPDDYRPYVEPHIKDIQSNVNKKFMEHANYRKQYEPYENLNITDYDPEDLQGLFQFAEIANNPETFKEWWNTVGKENGYIDELVGDESNDDEDFEDNGFDPDQMKSMFEQMLDAKLSPIAAKNAQFEEQQRLAEAETAIDKQIADLKEKHGEFDEQTVYKLAMGYEGPDAIQQGFQDYQDLVAGIERDTVARKGKNSTSPEGPGPANTNGKAITSFDDAEAAAMERFKQANQ